MTTARGLPSPQLAVCFSVTKPSATAFITELLAMTDIPDDALVDKVGAIGRFATCCPTRRPGCIALTNLIDDPADVGHSTARFQRTGNGKQLPVWVNEVVHHRLAAAAV